jgi:hypothetical protein
VRSIRGVAASLFGLGCVLAACGGSTSEGSGPSGSATVSGRVGGHTVPTSGTIGLLGTGTVQEFDGSATSEPGYAYTGAMISNAADLCSLLTQGRAPHEATMLVISVSKEGASSIAPGTYAISPSGPVVANVGFVVQDASCHDATSIGAVSGSVTIGQVTSTSIDGSFDVTMQSGDHLTGSFSAPTCTYDPMQVRCQG